MTGIHLHRAVTMNDVMGVERIIETGYDATFNLSLNLHAEKNMISITRCAL